MTNQFKGKFNSKNERSVPVLPTAPVQLADGSHLARDLQVLASKVAYLERRTIDPDSPLSTSEVLEEIRRMRALRTQFFAHELFADPAWDILLELKHAENLQLKVTVSNLCAAAAVPATTALRWISNLVERGMVVRTDDNLDGRRVFISLHSTTSKALEKFLEKCAVRSERFKPAETLQR